MTFEFIRKKRKTLLFFLFFIHAVGVVETPAQTADQLRRFSEEIRFGTPEVKRNALFDLRNFRTERAARAALPALVDESEIVRATAAATIVFLPKAEAARALLPILSSDKSEFVRREAAYALGETFYAEAAPELIRVLQKDKKQSVRDAAAVALGKLGNPLAIAPLNSILSEKPKESRNFLRRAAARSIGQIAETLQNIEITLETPENFLPLELKKIEKTSPERFRENESVFLSAVQILIRTLQNPKESDDTRREAAFALGAIGSPTAVRYLRANLSAEDVYLAEISKEALLKIEN